MMHMTFAPAVLATVKSATRPGVTHEIRMGRDGNVWCDCESWKYQAKPVNERTCKHLQAFALQANLPQNMMVAYQRMMSAMVAPVAPAPKARTAKPGKVNPWTAAL